MPDYILHLYAAMVTVVAAVFFFANRILTKRNRAYQQWQQQEHKKLLKTRLTYVKVVSCSDSSFWYADHIGEVFPVLNTFSDEVLVRTPSGYSNIIRNSDFIEIRYNSEKSSN